MSRKPPDFDLWAETAKTIKPLCHRAAKSPSPVTIGMAAIDKRRQGPVPQTPHVSAPHVHVPTPLHKAPPQITGLDRRTTQKLTRGQVDIERRLDLHGSGIELARVHLLQFLREAQSTGTRTVLVITGKGDSPYSRHTLHGSDHFHSPERAGRLRRLVPDWFHEAEFRSVVSGYQPAHPKHGGGGAFYVRVRRVRDDR